MSSGQSNAEVRTDGGAPSLTCLHEAPIVASCRQVAHSLRAEGFDASEDGTGRGTPLVVAKTLRASDGGPNRADNTTLVTDTLAPPLTTNPYADNDAREALLVSIHENQSGELVASDIAGALNQGGGKPGQGYTAVMSFNARQDPVAYGLCSDADREGVAKSPSVDAAGKSRLRDPGFNILEERAPTIDTGAAHRVGYGTQVRRLTPRECERLQGFPDDWTLVPYRGRLAADAPRYKALGNSMAVPVIRWICKRIELVDAEL